MFEDFSKKLSVFGQQVVKKTGEVAELASLKTKALAKKKKIQDEMLALGKAYYEAHKDEITEFEDKITAINTMYTELECLEKEYQDLKEKLPEEESIFEEEDLADMPSESVQAEEEHVEEQTADEENAVSEEANESEEQNAPVEDDAVKADEKVQEAEEKEEVKEEA